MECCIPKQVACEMGARTERGAVLARLTTGRRCSCELLLLVRLLVVYSGTRGRQSTNLKVEHIATDIRR